MTENKRQGTAGSSFAVGIVIMICAAITTVAGDLPNKAQIVGGQVGFAVGFLVAAIGAIAIGVEMGNQNSKR